jgi:hypothetical protein
MAFRLVRPAAASLSDLVMIQPVTAFDLRRDREPGCARAAAVTTGVRRDPRYEDGDIRAASGPVENHPQWQQQALRPPLGDNEPAEQHRTQEQREPIVSAAVHPAVSAWEKPKTMQNNPAPASTAPGQSIRGRVDERLLRINANAPATAIAADTRLTYRQ